MGLISVPKSHERTTAVAFDNMGDTGTATAFQAKTINLPSAPFVVPATLVVEYTQQRISGTGVAYAQVSLTNATFYATGTLFTAGTEFFLHRTAAVGTARSRRVTMALPNTLMASGFTHADYIRVGMRGSGAEADTEWTITGISAYLIYLPA